MKIYSGAIPALRAMVDELATDLAVWIEDYYATSKNYPSELRRYERDMDVIKRARELLEKYQ